MTQYVSINDVEEQFQSEWVLLEDPDLNESDRIVGGVLRFHSADRDEVYKKARNLQLKHSAIFFAGPIPSDVEFIL